MHLSPATVLAMSMVIVNLAMLALLTERSTVGWVNICLGVAWIVASALPVNGIGRKASAHAG